MKNIMLIDDEKELCGLLAEVLTLENYNVRIANTLRQAVSILAEEVELPDMVFLDLNLPDGDGISIVHEIKKISKKITICIASAHGVEKGKQEAKQMGVSYFIDKPFSIEDILKIIREATSN